MLCAACTALVGDVHVDVSGSIAVAGCTRASTRIMGPEQCVAAFALTADMHQHCTGSATLQVSKSSDACSTPAWLAKAQHLRDTLRQQTHRSGAGAGAGAGAATCTAITPARCTRAVQCEGWRAPKLSSGGHGADELTMPLHSTPQLGAGSDMRGVPTSLQTQHTAYVVAPARLKRGKPPSTVSREPEST